MRLEGPFLLRQAVSEIMSDVCIPAGCQRARKIADSEEEFFECPNKTPTRTLNDLLRGCPNAIVGGKSTVITLPQHRGSYY